MDTFENEIPEVNQDNEYCTEPEVVVTNRKPSPFADSPYVMNQDITERHANRSAVKTKKTKKATGRIWKRIVAAVLVILLVAGSCGATALVLNGMWEDRLAMLSLTMNQKFDALQKENESNQLPVTPGGSASMVGNLLTPSQVYQKCISSVVGITTYVRSSNGNTYTAYSSGSGFILTENGYAVTNCHVVNNSDKVVFTTHDGKEYAAKVVGKDEANDVALLKAVASGLHPVTLGSSNMLSVGDQVVAIGNPLGVLTSTQTVGYISGKDRSVATDGSVINMLQTDAAINSGNSGGPLFDMNGYVVGITTAKYSGTTGSGATIEGIGFAIPIDDVLDILEDLGKFGYVTSGYLGVTVSDTNATAANMFNLPLGAYIHSVNPGSSAEKGGILPKDIIVELAGYKIGGLADLTKVLRKFKGGEEVVVTIFRSGSQKQLRLVLDEKPAPADT